MQCISGVSSRVQNPYKRCYFFNNAVAFDIKLIMLGSTCITLSNSEIMLSTFLVVAKSAGVVVAK